MAERIWTDQYTQAMSETMSYEKYTTVLDVLSVATKRFGKSPAFSNLGVTMSSMITLLLSLHTSPITHL